MGSAATCAGAPRGARGCHRRGRGPRQRPGRGVRQHWRRRGPRARPGSRQRGCCAGQRPAAAHAGRGLCGAHPGRQAVTRDMLSLSARLHRQHRLTAGSTVSPLAEQVCACLGMHGAQGSSRQILHVGGADHMAGRSRCTSRMQTSHAATRCTSCARAWMSTRSSARVFDINNKGLKVDDRAESYTLSC